MVKQLEFDFYVIMKNGSSWSYYPPTYRCNSKHKEEDCPKTIEDFCKYDCEDYKLKTYSILPNVKNPRGELFSLDDINKELEHLEFGNRKQIEFLAALNFINQSEEEDITDKTEFYIN